jgi:hypothetical protein
MFAGEFTALARVCDSRLIFALISSGLSEFLLLTAEYALGVKSFGLKAWAALHEKCSRVKVLPAALNH